MAMKVKIKNILLAHGYKENIIKCKYGVFNLMYSDNSFEAHLTGDIDLYEQEHSKLDKGSKKILKRGNEAFYEEVFEFINNILYCEGVKQGFKAVYLHDEFYKDSI